VSANVTVKTARREDGAYERRNASECELNRVISCIRNGALKVGLVKTKVS
jgi:hypothetical protein